MTLQEHYARFKYNSRMTMEERIEISRETRFLDLNGMGLTKLPSIDFRVIVLWCDNNQLTSLEGIPPLLTVLSCSNNVGLSISDDILPRFLISLTCVGCNLTTLPALPKALETLNCNDNRIETLPPLPQTLKELHCGNNCLKSLPRIPASVITLSVGINRWSPRFLSHITGLILINDVVRLRKAVRAYHLQCHKLDKGFNKLLLFEERLRANSKLNNDVIGNICSFVTGYNGPFATQADLVSRAIASGELI